MGDKNSSGRRVGEVLATLGVIASLAVVAVEIRQNTDAVRGATLQAVSQQSMDLVIVGLENPELRLAFDAAEEERLTPDQRDLMGWFYSAKMRADENRFRQVQLGTLDPSTFQTMSNHYAYRFPEFRAWWARSGQNFAADFQELVEREFLPLSPRPSGEDR